MSLLTCGLISPLRARMAPKMGATTAEKIERHKMTPDISEAPIFGHSTSCNGHHQTGAHLHGIKLHGLRMKGGVTRSNS